MNKVICLLAALGIMLSGCGGRDPNPISVKEVGDSKMDCEDIAVELSDLDVRARRLLGEQSGKLGKNAAWGLGGLIIWPLLFALDLSDAERQEAEALQDRYRHLERIYNKKDCEEF